MKLINLNKIITLFTVILLNILSVKAQELFNYPLLLNGDLVYSTYGF